MRVFVHLGAGDESPLEVRQTAGERIGNVIARVEKMVLRDVLFLATAGMIGTTACIWGAEVVEWLDNRERQGLCIGKPWVGTTDGVLVRPRAGKGFWAHGIERALVKAEKVTLLGGGVAYAEGVQ